MSTIEAVAARTFNIAIERLTDDVAYQSIPEWDSFAHVQLMLALEQEFDFPMTNELLVELGSIGAIKAFVAGRQADNTPAPAAADGDVDSVEVHRGLNGVYFDRSAITHIDGDNGRLAYRGYDVNDLADNAGFEETVWLLLHGELPTAAELRSFREQLGTYRAVPGPVLAILDAMKSAHPMEALTTAVSALGTFDDQLRKNGARDAMDAGLRLIAQVPTVIAAHHALRNGRAPLAPRPELSHAHDFVRMLLGAEPSPDMVRLIDQDLTVHADHSSNASAFTARIAIGSGAKPHAAITAALAVFAGPLHGGAVEEALRQLDRIATPENAAPYVSDLQSRNLPVMGFGHRVYRTEDPRVRHFRRTARAMSRQRNDMRGFEVIEALVEAMRPLARLGIGPNVDLYAGLTYRLMGLPDDLAVAIFAAGRMPGWIAQALEQTSNNILIRPLLHYVGTASRPFVPLAERLANARAERVA